MGPSILDWLQSMRQRFSGARPSGRARLSLLLTPSRAWVYQAAVYGQQLRERRLIRLEPADSNPEPDTPEPWLVTGLRREQIQNLPLTVCVPAHRVTVRISSVPQDLSADLCRELLAAETALFSQGDAESWDLVFTTLDTDSELLGNEEQPVLVFSIAASELDRWLELADGQALPLERVDIDYLAVQRFLATQGELLSTSQLILIGIHGEALSLTLFERDLPRCSLAAPQYGGEALLSNPDLLIYPSRAWYDCADWLCNQIETQMLLEPQQARQQVFIHDPRYGELATFLGTQLQQKLGLETVPASPSAPLPELAVELECLMGGLLL